MTIAEKRMRVATVLCPFTHLLRSGDNSHRKLVFLATLPLAPQLRDKRPLARLGLDGGTTWRGGLGPRRHDTRRPTVAMSDAGGTVSPRKRYDVGARRAD